MSKQGAFVEQFALLRDIHSDLDEMFEPDEVKEELDELAAVEKACMGIVYRLHDIETDARALRLAVIGNFNAGKSSLINSLLGHNICPVGVCPTTSSITRFTYGTEKLVRQRGRGEITFEEYQHRVQHRTDVGTDPTPVPEFDVEYPYEALRDLEIIDTPGFENVENPSDTNITERAASGADALLFVLDVGTGAIGADTLEILNRIRKNKSECPWTLVLNHADKKTTQARADIRDRLFREHRHLFDAAVLYSVPWASAADPEAENSWLRELGGRIQRAAEGGLPVDVAAAGRPGERGAYGLTLRVSEGDQKYPVRFADSHGVDTVVEMRTRITELSRHKRVAAEARLRAERAQYLVRARALEESLRRLLQSKGAAGQLCAPWSEVAKETLDGAVKAAARRMRRDLDAAWCECLTTSELREEWDKSFWGTPLCAVELKDQHLLQKIAESGVWDDLNGAVKQFAEDGDHDPAVRRHLCEVVGRDGSLLKTKKVFGQIVIFEAWRLRKHRVRVYRSKVVAESLKAAAAGEFNWYQDTFVDDAWQDVVVHGYVNRLLDAAKERASGATSVDCDKRDGRRRDALQKVERLLGFLENEENGNG